MEGPAADGRPPTVAETPKTVTDYRAALPKKDRARFAALEGKPSRLGPELWTALGLGAYAPERLVTRAGLAVVLDEILDPFALKPVDHRGRFKP